MTTQAPQQTRVFVAESEVSAVHAPHLSDEAQRDLLNAINDVRTGKKVFYVRLTNRKVTKAPARVPEQDYRPDPGLQPHAHEGWLIAAPTNRKRKVYLRLKDEARQRMVEDDGPRGWFHTCISLEGIRSFKILRDAPGPEALAQPQPQAAPAQAVAAPAFDAQLAAQALMLQSQALMCQAQALMLRAYGQPQPPQPPSQ